MNYPYWVAIGLLMLGLYTMIAHRNLVKKAVGMTIFQTAIILFFLLLAVKRDATLPILSGADVDPARFMNPLPHALMLTAIVVMVATSGVALAILIRLYARYGSLEEDVIAEHVTRDETHPRLMRAHLPILPVLLPLLGALLQPILGLASRHAGWPLAVGTVGATAAAGIAGLLDVLGHGPHHYAVGDWAPPWGIEIVLDPLSAFLICTIAVVATLTLLAGGPSARVTYEREESTYYSLVLLLVTGLLGMVVSGDLFNVFVFLEVASISSYALVASGGGPALAAAFRYVVLGTVGASFYLLGVGCLYALTGTLNMADLAARLPAATSSPLFVGGIVFIVVGLAVKMGLFPLHGWLPDAYTRAPAPVTAVMAPVGTKAAAYVLARVLLYVLRPEGLPVGTTLAWVGAVAIVAGGILAAMQVDARRLLAYSSVSQMGYIALGLGLGVQDALIGSYLHILAHALMKAALFVVLAATALDGRAPTLGALRTGSRMPITGACAVVAALSVIGVPPAAGFFSKWYLLQGALAAGQPILAGAILGGSLLGAVYMYRFTEAVWFGKPRATAGPPEAPMPLLAGLVALAVATVAVGLGNTALVSNVLGPAAAGGRPVTQASVLPGLALLPAALAVVLIVLSRQRPAVRETWSILAAIAQSATVIAMIPSALSGTILVWSPFTLVEGAPFVLRADPLGVFFGTVASVLWVLTTVYSIGYTRALREHAQTRYFAAFALSLFATVGLALAGNFVTFFGFFEILTVATYPLVIHKETEEAARAGRVYLAYTLTAGAALLGAVAGIHALAGRTDFEPGGILAGSGATSAVLWGLFILCLVGCGVKAAVVPLHTWLPIAMIAPTPVSALLHAVAVVKAGVFGLARVAGFIFGPQLLRDMGAAEVLVTLALVTILLGSLAALVQDNLKRLLAFSTVSQLSYIVLGVSLGGADAFAGGVLHIASHGLLKITLFFCAGALYVAAGVERVSQMDGIGRRMPITMTAFATAAFLLAGLPPGLAFASKWRLVRGAVDAHAWLAVATLSASTVLNIAYFAPIVGRAFRRGTGTPVREAPLPMLAPLVITAAAGLLLGIDPDAGVRLWSLARAVAASVGVTR